MCRIVYPTKGVNGQIGEIMKTRPFRSCLKMCVGVHLSRWLLVDLKVVVYNKHHSTWRVTQQATNIAFPHHPEKESPPKECHYLVGYHRRPTEFLGSCVVLGRNQTLSQRMLLVFHVYLEAVDRENGSYESVCNSVVNESQ